jgi:hypothetical protein
VAWWGRIDFDLTLLWIVEPDGLQPREIWPMQTYAVYEQVGGDSVSQDLLTYLLSMWIEFDVCRGVSQALAGE